MVGIATTTPGTLRSAELMRQKYERQYGRPLDVLNAVITDIMRTNKSEIVVLEVLHELNIE
jgi:hypothetical protein